MSTEEVLKDWEKFFFLILENTEDDSYKEAEKTISEEFKGFSSVKQDFIDGILDFRSLVGIYISAVIISADKGLDRLKNLDLDQIAERVNDFWVRYLKKPTRNFTSKRGLPPLNTDNLEITFQLKSKLM